MPKEKENPIDDLGPVQGQKSGVEPSKEELKKDDPSMNEQVTMTRGQLQGILAEIDALKRGVKFERPRRVTDRTAKMRFHEEKPVVWYGNIRETKEALTGKMIAFMDIKVLGSDKVIVVEYLKFLNEPNSVQVQIKSQVAEKITDTQGVMQAQNPNPHFDKKWQSFETELEVVGYRYTAEVEVLEGDHKGDVFTVPADALNQ